MPAQKLSVSVVMAVRNGAAFLTKAVESVREQTFEDLELIVVDDGSTDGTPELLVDLARRDDRIRVFREPSKGVSSARNRACREARGQYLAILDADDEALPRRLELQVAFLDSHPDVAVVGGAGIFINEEGVEFGTATYPTNAVEVDSLLRSGRVPIMQSAATIRTKTFRATSGYRPVMEPAEDYELWLRIAHHGRIANLPDPVVRYRIHSRQASIRDLTKTAIAVRVALAAEKARERGQPDPLDEAESLDPPLLARLGVAPEDIAASEVDYALWLARTLARGGYHEQAKPLWALCLARSGATAHRGATLARVLRARADICDARRRCLRATALRAFAVALQPRSAAARLRGLVVQRTARS